MFGSVDTLGEYNSVVSTRKPPRDPVFDIVHRRRVVPYLLFSSRRFYAWYRFRAISHDFRVVPRRPAKTTPRSTLRVFFRYRTHSGESTFWIFQSSTARVCVCLTPCVYVRPRVARARFDGFAFVINLSNKIRRRPFVVCLRSGRSGDVAKTLLRGGEATRYGRVSGKKTFTTSKTVLSARKTRTPEYGTHFKNARQPTT